jgi:serine/threonine protein kinase
MEGLLKMDPKERFTSRDAMAHAFFDGLRTESEEALCIDHKQ